MPTKKNIDFVRLDILENWRFWNQFAVTQDYEAAGKEAIAQANALLAQDCYSNERAAMLLEESKNFQSKKIEAGRKGGQAKARNAKAEQPKTNNQSNQPQRKKDPTKQDVIEFAQDHKLDVDDAREWYEQNYVERPSCDKHGEVIRNWTGALINACKAAKKKREKAQ